MAEKQITALALPDEDTFKRDIQAINRFQQIAHANMKSGHDYGVIPGTGNKPTLLKPGAEKIAKLLGLADHYEILDKTENWEVGFFRYLVRCSLVHFGSGQTISEGLGECNSKESKYRWRWVFASDLPEYLQGNGGKAERDKLQYRMVNTRNGKAKTYKVENDDVFSQVNTIVKMAKKRALVDAALSAGRLSEVFTQDIEDTGKANLQAPPKAQPQPKPQTTTVTEQEPQGEPTTIQELMEWVGGHGKTYTPSWVKQSFTWPDEATSDAVKTLYEEIVAVTGWEPR